MTIYHPLFDYNKFHAQPTLIDKMNESTPSLFKSFATALAVISIYTGSKHAAESIKISEESISKSERQFEKIKEVYESNSGKLTDTELLVARIQLSDDTRDTRKEVEGYFSNPFAKWTAVGAAFFVCIGHIVDFTVKQRSAKSVTG